MGLMAAGHLVDTLGTHDDPDDAALAFETWRDLDPIDLKKQAPGSRNVKQRFAPAEVNAPHGADAPTAVTTGFVDGSVLIEMESLIPDAESSVPSDRWIPAGVLVPRPEPGWESTGPGIKQRVWPKGGQRFDLRPEGYLGSEWPAATVLRGLTPEHFTGENQPPDRVWGLRTLELIDDIGIVAVPDLMWPGYPPPPVRRQPRRRCEVLPADDELIARRLAEEGRQEFSLEEKAEAQRAVIRHCVAMRDRFAVLDAPAGLRPDEVVAWVAGKPGGDDGLRSDAGQYAALYYPWVFVPDPGSDALVQAVPPSGHVAGMFARIDRSVGVHKPPANEAIEAVSGTERDLDAATHGWLNDEAVNAIRAYPGRGVRVAGARTLVPPGAAELRPWRFVNVRRLLLMIEESIEQATQWVVFEPNAPVRWREVDRVIRNFLDDEWLSCCECDRGASHLDAADAEFVDHRIVCWRPLSEHVDHVDRVRDRPPRAARRRGRGSRNGGRQRWLRAATATIRSSPTGSNSASTRNRSAGFPSAPG